jgi:hypothetical protein
VDGIAADCPEIKAFTYICKKKKKNNIIEPLGVIIGYHD